MPENRTHPSPTATARSGYEAPPLPLIPSPERRGPRAFTLIELLVVITIIVVLLALLTPALDKAIEAAERAVCAANQDTIQTGSVMYALENRHDLIACRGREVEMSFTTKYYAAYSMREGDQYVDWLAALGTVGLAGSSPVVESDGIPHHVPGKMWFCPSSGYEGYWDPNFGQQYCTSYQYYGGIETWRSALSGEDTEKGRRSRSPVKLNTSKGDWVLTADRSILFRRTAVLSSGSYAWDDGGLPYYWKGNPNHPSAERKGPAGNNQSYVDGSVGWVDGERLINIHSYRDGDRQTGFFYQKDLGGWVPPEETYAKEYFD